MFAFQNGNYDYSNFIKELTILTNCQNYLELGISDGKNFNIISANVKNAVGVDIVDARHVKNGGTFYKCTTDDFFQNNKQLFDIIFIDADHKYESVKKDFENSIKVLNKYGIIIMHDTDPSEEMLLQDKYCSDSYKIINYVKNKNGFDVITLPILNAGLTIVKVSNELRINAFLNKDVS